jgi:anti-sigma regulatory factor (Ser/Thr protein kinase)
LDLSADRLMVQVADDGIPFNPLPMDKPDTKMSLDDRKIGGLGIHLVRHMMSKVSYQRRVGKNVITMIEYLNPD